MHTTSEDEHDVLVVGAGPAGLATIASLLVARPTINLGWIDPDFTGGRLQNYLTVPSNTRVRLFRRYREHVERAIGYSTDDRDDWFEGKDGEAHCELRYAAEMVKKLNRAMIMSERVTSVYLEKCVDIYCCRKADRIVVKTDQNRRIKAKAVILATGCRPRECRREPSESVIDLDTALNIYELRSRLKGGDKVVVFGNSHSAALVMRNLHLLKRPFKCVYKRDPLFAIYSPTDPQIIYDNTGLKGVAAEWMRANWDSLEKAKLTEYKEDDGWKVVEAIGFERCATLAVHVDDAVVPLSELGRHRDGGPQLYHSEVPIAGLFGAGIAFPGIDKYDYNGGVIVEQSVGMFKFCRHADSDVKAVLAHV